MEVTSKNNHITHAVIGQHQSQNMGISDSPEFFQILSSSLYTDQILAVVREVMCNAWDAHIEAGVTDKPVQVTLNGAEFIVRDFGTGIAKNMMQPIYGVYGQSTKKTNGNVTGGFGLGCKAPFAYVEHFEVTSWHGGEKTIYNISKSASETLGKPSITPIVSIPTDQTGLQVSIKIKENNYREFSENLFSVISNGEIFATVNGATADYVKYSESEYGYTILTNKPTLVNDIYIRYGHVIYPLPSREEYSSEYIEAAATLTKVNEGYTRLTLVLQAPPNSVAVTPSREQLSFQQDTVKTVKELLINFNNKTKSLKEKNIHIIAKEFLKTLNKEEYAQYLKLNKNVFKFAETQTLINTPEQLKLNYLKKHNVELYNNKSFVINKIKNTVKAEPNKKILAHAVITEIKKSDNRHQKYKTWVAKTFAKPVVKALEKIGVVKPLGVNFYISSLNINGRYTGQYTFPYYSNTTNYYELLKTLNICLILSFDKTLPERRIGEFPVLKEINETEVTCLVYKINRNDKNLDKIREIFSKLNLFKFIDLTVAHPWESPKIVEPKPKVERAYVPKGFVTLKDTLTYSQDKNCIQVPNLEKDAVRIQNPKAVMLFKDVCELYKNQSRKDLVTISKCFGQEIVTVEDKIKYNSAINKGAVDVKLYLVTELLQSIKSSSNLKNYFILKNTTKASEAKNSASIQSSLLSLISQCNCIQEHLKLNSQLTEKEECIVQIYSFLKQALNVRAYQELESYIYKLGINQEAVNIVEKSASRLFVKYLDMYTLVNEFKYAKNFASLSPELKKILLIIF